MTMLDTVRAHVLSLPDLAKFAIVIAVLVGIPPLSRRIGIPGMVGLLLFGVILGPHVLGFFGENHPVASFFAELGKLLLMFAAGLEVDMQLFRQAEKRAIAFGVATTMTPLLLGTACGLAFGYAVIPAIVIGSLLASHTLLSLPIITRLGAGRLEPPRAFRAPEKHGRLTIPGGSSR
jgi:Kef-type K+ transport system membrane component KefB